MNGEWSVFGVIIVGIYGLLVGSFLNAWIWRVHTNRRITKGRSICPHCKVELEWYELVPVLSWLGLRGKCRRCHKAISWQYPAVELANALIWVSLLVSLAPSDIFSWVLLICWLLLSSLLLAMFVYDMRWMLLPNIFIYPSVALSIIIMLFSVFVSISFAELSSRLIATAIFAGSFYIMSRLSRERWLGYGDAWLAMIMGLVLTSLQLVVAIFVAFNLGAIVGLILIATHRKSRKSQIAFGPFLIIGLFSGLFFGELLLNWYLGIFV